MSSKESCLCLVHYQGSIKKKICSSVKFTDKDPLSIFLKSTMSFADFLNFIIQKFGLQGMKRVEKLFYHIPISCCEMTDEDLEAVFHCRRQFSEVRTPELLTKLVDVVSSLGGSNRNTQTPITAAYSSSTPVGASSCVPVIAPQDEHVAFLSFAVDLNRSSGRECGASAGIDDALPDDDDANDVEPDIIADDSSE
ncbi:hypothetical protein Ahy_A07g031735 [Arachis hypogaea]|uniref:Uncharacterized protein n=1 Tax=Arachis hypogaea TaxID=3818 RepID=A0A445C4V1_ARAHY|nr:hypothetical protein Ahy_A07g031735 [Arachis hypogaea]